jgi:hypothetical protein
MTILLTLLIMKTPANLTDGNQNELQYTKDVQNTMKNPTVYHLQDELNRKKICYFIDKYVTMLYGSRHITLWVVKKKNRTILDLVTISYLAYTVVVIKNGHEIWEQLNETQNSLGEEELQG